MGSTKSPIVTAVSGAEVTSTRPQAIRLSEKLEDPGIGRANIAATAEAPNGTPGWAEKHQDKTVAQQHILFFDTDGDGIIWPLDTYRGFRELGFNIPFSLITIIINIAFSFPTRIAHTWVPDPFFRIYIDSIHRSKHGSDTGVIDREGRFVPQAFEDMFATMDKDGDGCLSLRDFWDLIGRNKVVADVFGWTAQFFEWGTVWLLFQRDGLVSKEDIRRTYDGSIFYEIRERRKTGQGWDKGYGLRDLFRDLFGAKKKGL
ncbi:Caleosin related protein-domain-containing protein [Coniochaeta sp. 2T2.1]|nr:Caleosin related protein-domain-containing protein [Coniochaeta sp. 2T2.1]